MNANPSHRKIGVFVMALSGLALAGPGLLLLAFWGFNVIGEIWLGLGTISIQSETKADPIGSGAYVIAFTAAFMGGFHLTRKGSQR